MFARVNPKEAQALMAQGVTVIDVRDHEEWSKGHIPGARRMGLEDLRASKKKNLPRGAVLFVCAGGIRSETAGRIALDLGLTEVYSLVGGTRSWMNAGLPIALEPASGLNVKPLRTRRPAASAA